MNLTIPVLFTIHHHSSRTHSLPSILPTITLLTSSTLCFACSIYLHVLTSSEWNTKCTNDTAGLCGRQYDAFSQELSDGLKGKGYRFVPMLQVCGAVFSARSSLHLCPQTHSYARIITRICSRTKLMRATALHTRVIRATHSCVIITTVVSVRRLHTGCVSTLMPPPPPPPTFVGVCRLCSEWNVGLETSDGTFGSRCETVRVFFLLRVQDCCTCHNASEQSSQRIIISPHHSNTICPLARSPTRYALEPLYITHSLSHTRSCWHSCTHARTHAH
jgi:hypothetical protein